jgi:SulP family sulfate permease
VAVKGLINVAELKHLFRVSRADFRIALLALAGVLVFGILRGVLLAAMISLLMLVRRAARPYTAVIGRIPGTNQFADVTRHEDAETVPGILAYRVYGGIVYFNVDHVQHEFLRLVASQDPPVTLAIFDLSSSPTVDLAGMRMLRTLHEQLAERGVTLELAEARGAVRDLLEIGGLGELFTNAGGSVTALSHAQAAHSMW